MDFQTLPTLNLRRGTPPKLTEEKALAILSHIGQGKFLKEALGLESISSSSFYRHIEDFPEIHGRIKEAMEQQKSLFKEEALRTIRDAFATDWKAAAWYLERTYPCEYGRVRHEFTGADGGPILLARGVTEISDEELTRLIAEKEKHDAERIITIPETTAA